MPLSLSYAASKRYATFFPVSPGITSLILSMMLLNADVAEAFTFIKDLRDEFCICFEFGLMISLSLLFGVNYFRKDKMVWNTVRGDMNGAGGMFISRLLPALLNLKVQEIFFRYFNSFCCISIIFCCSCMTFIIGITKFFMNH